MKKMSRIFCMLLLSFCFLLTSAGFAALTDTMQVSGELEAHFPEGLFIVSVTPVSNTDVTAVDTGFFAPTNVTATMNAAGSTRTTNNITYEIVVVNRTDYIYNYKGVECERNLTGYNGNTYINQTNGISITTKDQATDTSATFNTQDSIGPRETRTFYATYSYASSRWGWGSYPPRGTDLATCVNFKFAVNVDSVEDAVVERTFSHFEQVLNDTVLGGNYEKLLDMLDDKYQGGGAANQWQATYIGNVTGSYSSDSQRVNELFGGELSIEIDGVTTNVTVIIKHEPLDGNDATGDDYEIGTGNNYIHAEGCEMTLYMTTDDLSSQNNTPVVYASVFTCNRNPDGSLGEWFMSGDMYVGTAPVIGYEGEDSTGSFHTDSWVSSGTHTYKVTDSYSYSVGGNQKISAIVQATDAKATAELTALLGEAARIVYEGNYSGSAMDYLTDVYTRASYYYTDNGDGTVTVQSGLSRARIVPMIRELTTALSAFREHE